MTRQKKASSGNYKIGYGRPPTATRFRKGTSGNPGGRPRGMTPGRAKRLALQEAYRPITVREGDEVLTLPTIQAVMRQQGRLAAKGNGPAQRDFIGRAIEQEEAIEATKVATQNSPITDQDRVRALAVLLAKTGYKLVPVTPNTMGNSALAKLQDRVKNTVKSSGEE
jgi:Family of unknown function (DUF5681)